MLLNNFVFDKILSLFFYYMFDFESFWLELWEIVREEQYLFMKMKMIILTAMLTFSYSVITEAAIPESSDQDERSGENLYQMLYPIEDLNTNFIEDMPFSEMLSGTIPHIYPPLESMIDEQVTYTVVQGDNLFRISMNHNITVEELRSLNGLVGDIIFPGDELIVGGTEVESKLGTSDAKVDTMAEITPQTVPKESVAKTTIGSPSTPEGTEMTVTATAYTAYCTGCSGTTAIGIDLRSNPNQKVIAVDPSIIPLGTKVWVEGYGEAIAGDVGSAIKGNKIDVFIPSYESAMEWGVKKVKIKVLN